MGGVEIIDYMDLDVAYLLGMIFAHGRLVVEGDIRRLIIEIPIRRKLPNLPSGIDIPDIDLAAANERALAKARSRINELLEVNVDVDTSSGGKRAVLKAVFTKRTIAWRNLEFLCGGTMPSNFKIPPGFMRFPIEIHKEFIRGYADAAVMPNKGDALPTGVQRIAFPVVYTNKKLFRDLRAIFRRVGLRAKGLSGEPEKRGGQSREHRLRYLADEYLDALGIGFHFEHKQQLLDALARYNMEIGVKNGTKRRNSPLP